MGASSAASGLALVEVRMFPLVAQICMALVYTRVLPMRRPALFIVLHVLTSIPIIFLRDAFPAIRMPLSFLATVVLPWLFWRGRVSQKTFALLIMLMLMFAAEAASAFVWSALTGGARLADELVQRWPVQYFAANLTWWLSMLGLGALASRALSRFSHALPGGGARVWAALVLAQFLFAAVLMFWGLFALHDTEGYYTGPIVLAVLCLLVDSLMLVTAHRLRSARMAKQRSEMLEEELDAYLRHCQQMLSHLEEAARQRHDARNHLQVIDALLERGDEQGALRYVRDIRASYEGGGRVDGEGA